MSRRNGLLRLTFAGVCAWTGLLCADNGPEAATSSLLVLKNGQVVRGQLQSDVRGFYIEQEAGRLFVGTAEIWVQADSLTEAHDLMRDSYDELTPEICVDLAKWCITQRIWGTAKRNALDALHLDPDHEDAKETLAVIVQTQQQAVSSIDRSPSVNLKSALATMALARENPAGLSRETAQHFTRRIQPILCNLCERCHSENSGREFVLVAPKQRTSGATTERNLAAVMKQIDGTSGTSPLVTMATTAHGGSQDIPLRGRHAARLQMQLEDWVATVSDEYAAESQGKSAGQQSRKDPDPIIKRVTGTEITEIPHGDQRRLGDRDEEFVTSARKQVRRDTFNPEIFNQRYRRATIPVASRAR